MKKKLLATLLTVALAVTGLTGCGDKGTAGDDAPAGSDNSTTQSSAVTDNGGDAASVTDPVDALIAATDGPVSLRVWAAEEDQDMVKGWCDEFAAQYPDVTFNFEVGVQSESTAKDTVLADVEAAADVFSFAGDQLMNLVKAGALQEVVIYNKGYFTEDDVKSLDRIMEVAAENGKQFSMMFNSGWYNLSFFLGAGFNLSLNEDGSQFCDWNGTSSTGIAGVDVVQAMLDIAANPAFISLGDAEFNTGVTEGMIIAGINGDWSANNIADAWGDNYAATCLPTYTCAGQQLQMMSVTGYKMFGVNAYSQNAGWAMLLAEYFTEYDQQVERFELRGAGPANIEAAASDAVKQNIAIAAQSLQSQYAVLDGCESGNFWTPAETFGAIIASGNPDGIDLQTLLDNLIDGVSQPVAQ